MVRITNYEAGSVWDYNIGVRERMDTTRAMLPDSLMCDHLMSIGMKVSKAGYSKDVIGMSFGYGARGKEYVPRGKIREVYYRDGVEIDGIKYKMLYRTPGKAKQGNCMFICERLYDKAHDFLYMGMKPVEGEKFPIVEVGAYSSLVASGIVGYVQITPEQIFVTNDVKTICKRDVERVYVDGHCKCERAEDYEIESDIYDGQALIDESVFPEWGDGYVLLRHHFSKMAAFKTRIQKFFKDYYKDEYEDKVLTDVFGREIPVKNIRLITTPNGVKWRKLGIGFDTWAEKIRENGCRFGIVKTSHKSKLGEVQRMSYQMVNSLDIDSMEGVLKTTREYLISIKTDPEAYKKFLEENANFTNDYKMMLALVEHNPDFAKTQYYHDRRVVILYDYMKNLKRGKILQNADNLTIVGNPYGMLMTTVGEDSDETFDVEDGAIQCWTSRFRDNEYLAEFRNPFNSRNNLGYLHNLYHPLFDKYFDFGDLVIAVNMRGTDFQSRNNGSDQDSDSIYVTNQPDIVRHAERCYKEYPTIVNEIKEEKNEYTYDMLDFAAVDNKLQAAQMAIGYSSNLAQLALTYTYNFNDQIYYDATCILAVLAQWVSVQKCA